MSNIPSPSTLENLQRVADNTSYESAKNEMLSTLKDRYAWNTVEGCLNNINVRVQQRLIKEFCQAGWTVNFSPCTDFRDGSVTITYKIAKT